MIECKCKRCESEDVELEFYKETVLNDAFYDCECQRCKLQWVTPANIKEVIE